MGKYSKIFYVGDNHWDKNAADELNIEFIGLGDKFLSYEKSITDYTGKNIDILNRILNG